MATTCVAGYTEPPPVKAGYPRETPASLRTPTAAPIPSAYGPFEVFIVSADGTPLTQRQGMPLVDRQIEG
jgi:hypothetical protein